MITDDIIRMMPRGGRNPRATLELNLIEALVRDFGPITKETILYHWVASLPLIRQLTGPSTKEATQGPQYTGEPASWFGQRIGTLVSSQRVSACWHNGDWVYHDPRHSPT